MQSHYEINVSLNGRHYFATNERSLTGVESEARGMFNDMKKRYPREDGFELSLTHWEGSGTVIDTHLQLKETI